MSKVLVTGGSGFLGAHCILALLAEGHAVRTTVRSAAREGEVRAVLARGGAPDAGPRVEFAVADLTADAGWSEAAAGCDHVLHVASPFPAAPPKDEAELIGPARDGALRVLRAAHEAGVKRVVLTSSFAAVGYGAPGRAEPFTEADWTDAATPGLTPYVKSKTVAERAAWDYVAGEGAGLELAVVNPVGIFGPLLGPDYSTSILLIKRLLDGSVPGCPRLYFGAVDVRDTADLHLRAMTHPAAAGQRFLAVAGDFMTMAQMSRTLRAALGPAARKAPTRELPDWFVRAMALVDPAVRQITPELGKAKTASNDKAVRLLGWSPRSREEAVIATGRSLVDLGLI